MFICTVCQAFPRRYAHKRALHHGIPWPMMVFNWSAAVGHGGVYEFAFLSHMATMASQKTA
jgi:hypothetical protein